MMGDTSSSPTVFVFEIHLKKVFDVDLSNIIDNVSGVKLRNISTRQKHGSWKTDPYIAVGRQMEVRVTFP